MKIVLGIIGILVALAGGFAAFLLGGQKSGLALVINDVDISSVPDGVHTGRHKASRWSNTVEVTVAGHRIERVEVTDDIVYKDPKLARSIIDRVIDKQTPKVDAISGATITSKAYMKSIENALRKAK